MISARILAVLDDGPKRDALERQLENLGAEVFTSSTGPGGLLLLGRVQPDVLLLDPTIGRGRVEDWRRGIDRYRSNRSLSLWITDSAELHHSPICGDADLGSGSLDRPEQLLDLVEDEFGTGDGRQYAA